MQSSAKESSFHSVHAVWEARAREDGYLCHFIGLERLNIHTCMCQNVCLCKYPHKYSNVGSEWIPIEPKIVHVNIANMSLYTGTSQKIRIWWKRLF